MEGQAPKETGFEKFIRILGMIMSFVYVVIGVALFTKAINLSIDETYSKILGIGLVAYGAFRFYRAFKGPNTETR